MVKTENKSAFETTDLWMLLTTMVWAVNLSLIKFSLREFTPHGFNGIRLALSASIFLGILAFSRGGFPLGKGDFLKVAGLGLLGTTVYQLLFIQGISRTQATTTSMIMPMTPVFIAVLSYFFKLERIHWAAWMGIAVSFLGVYLLVTGQNRHVALTWQSVKGDVFLLLANLVWALYTVLAKPLLERIPPVKLTCLSVAIGTALYLPFAAADVRRVPWASISPGAWASLLYSAVLAIVVSFIVYSYSVRKVGNTKTGIYSNLNPVFAVIFAWFFLSERITALEAGGGLVIFLGVYLTRSGYRFFLKKPPGPGSVEE
jgi:drug/metabolite transporter (DMT)-like permease